MADSVKVYADGRIKTLRALMLGLRGSVVPRNRLSNLLAICMKYANPATAELMSQASLTRAWSLTVGTQDPTWNLEITSKSSMMLMTKLVELINKGTSGLSNARVQSATATCIAEDSDDTAEICT